MGETTWRHETGEGPLVAVAVHDGHAVRPEVEELLALAPAERLREEDPHTEEWAKVAPTRVIIPYRRGRTVSTIREGYVGA